MALFELSEGDLGGYPSKPKLPLAALSWKADRFL